ncbi:probable isoaspartyl peptidase/L-asparaginase CG7860 isoform X1 [Ceratitis capitata]|uniref:probable isoaspartyl peptidase/L-asparaginase CG7860 isoform X1 n=2 Tax=Ceratitis capitata TaxID=7213 RepID=UPI00032A1CC2|nr:probable isoaspartyl peptidase/L-asparaginase CG7860 isoform X1 [Ceratitis capitata]
MIKSCPANAFLDKVVKFLDVQRSLFPTCASTTIFGRYKSQFLKMSTPMLLVHGGAGGISDARILGKANGMKLALKAGLPLLIPSEESGGIAVGSALDAVEAAVRAMEEDENFNAGYGACLNSDGNVEVEASIMEGSQLRAGCVTLLHDIKYPITVARHVMEKTNHTFLGGASAQKFALQNGAVQLPQGSLVTPSACEALTQFKQQQSEGKDTTYAPTELDNTIKERPGEPGTVGAVAIDAKGNIAVATSTGGITGKVPGRIGDTPLLGCGTYADNKWGGVSTTGHGETIMRFNLAQKILANIRYCNMSAQEATEVACKEMTERLGGTGGAITIGPKGDIGISWTSKRMAWAYVRDNEFIYGIDHGKVLKEPF